VILRRALTGSAAAFVAVAAIPSAGGAQQVPRAADITLVAQTTWVGAGGEFELQLKPPSAVTPAQLAELELSVAVHPAISTRTAFARSLAERPPTSPLSVISTPVPALQTAENGVLQTRIGIRDPAAPRDPARVVLRAAGVYPVVVELRPPGGGAVRGRLHTHLLFVPTPPDGPRLGVTFIAPIARPPALRPDGTVRFADDAAKSFATLASTLAETPSGVVLDPNPETVAALARSSNEQHRAALAQLRALAGGRPVVSTSSFVPVARAAYTGVAGLEALQTLDERGRTVVETAFEAPVDARITIARAGVDEAHLPDVGIDARVVVPEELLAPVEERVTLANAIRLRRGTGRGAGALPAVLADTELGEHFDADRPPVLAAHHLLADLATIYFDNPGRRRSIVVMPGRSTRLRSEQVGAFLAGVRASPLLGLVDLDEQFAAAAGRAPVRTLAAPRGEPRPPDLGALRGSVTSLSLTFPDDPARVTSFSDRALITQSTDLRGRQRSAYLRQLRGAINAEGRQFRLPRRAAARLTARTGRIPITVNSEARYPARVLLEVASDKLRFPGGATRQLVLSRRNTTAQIGVATQGSGTFPLRVVLKTPDGKLVLAESRFTVQSTAVSGVGVFLSIGALFVLAGWWIRHNRRHRPRLRRQAEAAQRNA